MKKIFGLLVLSLYLFLPQAAMASLPLNQTFPSCPAVNGTVIASYATGTHWIAGENFLRQGSDTVFDLDNGNLVQCYCPTDNSAGIQTNWMDAQNISVDEKNSYTANGWIWVQDGADFGLASHPYLAQNLSSACSLPSPTPSPSSSCSPNQAPLTAPVAGFGECSSSSNTSSQTSANSSGGSSSGSSSSSQASLTASPQGEVLGITYPTSLAATGGNAWWQIGATLLISAFMIGYGIRLKIKNKI